MEVKDLQELAADKLYIFVIFTIGDTSKRVGSQGFTRIIYRTNCIFVIFIVRGTSERVGSQDLPAVWTDSPLVWTDSLVPCPRVIVSAVCGKSHVKWV